MSSRRVLSEQPESNNQVTVSEVSKSRSHRVTYCVIFYMRILDQFGTYLGSVEVVEACMVP